MGGLRDPQGALGSVYDGAEHSLYGHGRCRLFQADIRRKDNHVRHRCISPFTLDTFVKKRIFAKIFAHVYRGFKI